MSTTAKTSTSSVTVGVTPTPNAPSTACFELPSGFVYPWGPPAVGYDQDMETILSSMEKGHKVCRLEPGKRWEPTYRRLSFSRETRQLLVQKTGPIDAKMGKPSAVDLRTLKEVHSLAYKTNFMKIGDKWKRDKEIQQFDHAKILVLLHGTQFILKTYVFLFETADACAMWVEGLQHLMNEILFTSHPLLIERWLRKEFYNIANPTTQCVSMKHLKPFVQSTLQYKTTSKSLQELVTEESQNMPFEAFAMAYRKLIHIHSLFSDRFSVYSDDGKMVDFNAYLKFLNDQKDEMSHSKEWASENLRRYISDVDVSRDITEPYLTVSEFVDYLFSRENSIWNPLHDLVCQSMTHPLCDYWIASSHNTYLTGDQLQSESSLDAYSRALCLGCRCIELDCWDGQKRASMDPDVVIYHGYTMTTKINLRDVLFTIREYAFVASEFPVILSIEDNCSVPAQRVLASDLKEILGDYLLTCPVDKEETFLPSPKKLKYKIIVKHKKLRTEAERNVSVRSNASEHTLDDSLQDQDLFSRSDFQRKGVLHMRDEQGNWHPHMFALFNDKLCFTEDANLKSRRSNSRSDSMGGDSLSTMGDDDAQDEFGMELPGIKADEMHITEEWFHGRISREDAGKLLKANSNLGDGLFLVRESNTFIGDFSLSFWYRNEVHHCRIRTKMIEGEKKFFFLEAKMMDTLYEIISYYTKYPLTTPKFKATLSTPCPQPSPHIGQPWFAGTINKAKAEDMLNSFREDGAFLIRYSGSDPYVFVLTMRVDGQIWHMRLKRDGRIFLVNYTIFENLNLLVKFYQDHELFRGICLKYPVNEESIENYAHSDMTGTTEGCYMDLNIAENEIVVEAVEAHQGKDPTELTYAPGARISVIKKPDAPMWQGRYAGKIGWFPAHSVMTIYDGKGKGIGANAEQRDYGCVELAGCVIEKLENPTRPFAFKMRQGTSHWNQVEVVVAASASEEMEEWFNVLKETTETANIKRDELRGKEKEMRIASELSNLVVYCQAVPFSRAGNFYEMCSFSETKHDKLVEKGLIHFNRNQLSRVYPNASRIRSNNFNPIPMWNTGCHMVAMNYQNPDKSMQLNQGRFMANGRCGYVLKPQFMKEENYDPDKHETALEVSPLTLTIEVVAGRHLRRKDRTKGGIVSPVVEIEILGLPTDCQTFRTRAISSDGLHPMWSEHIEFNVRAPEVALLRLYVEDGDFLGPGTDPFIGQAVFPLECIRPGYRSVILRNTHSEEMELSSILLNVDIKRHNPVDETRIKSQNKVGTNSNVSRTLSLDPAPVKTPTSAPPSGKTLVFQTASDASSGPISPKGAVARKGFISPSTAATNSATSQEDSVDSNRSSTDSQA